MDKNECPPLGTAFLTYGGYGTKFDESLVVGSLENFYERFGAKPKWAWVHPTNEKKAQGIISELGGKLKIQSNGGTSACEFWLAVLRGNKENGSFEGRTGQHILAGT